MSAASAVLALALLALSGWTRNALAGEDFSELAFRPHPGARLPLASEFVDNQGSVVPLGRFEHWADVTTKLTGNVSMLAPLPPAPAVPTTTARARCR